MDIVRVEKIDQIKVGDLLLIQDIDGVILAKAEIVKVSEQDGTEIIFNKKKNKYFNLGMYLDGMSYVRDVSIVKP